jgi:endoglucanase
MQNLSTRLLAAGSVVLLSGMLVLGTACADASASTGPEDPAAPVTPEPVPQAFFNGAYLGDAVSNPQQIGAAIRDFGQMVGKQPALVKTFHPVSCDFTAQGWCGQVLRQVAQAGATNYVALDLRWEGAPRTGLLEAILAGRADAEFTRIGRGLATVPGTVLLEPAWEMNGDWQYLWQGVANGSDHTAPQKYAAAWRHIVDLVRAQGASNVRWVFNPNVGNPLTNAATGASHWNWYANYYPGDAYVDFVGAHGFNAPRVWGGAWKEFDDMVDGAAADHMLSDLASRYPGKPVIIGEFATDEGSGDAKARWIRAAFQHMRSHPAVVGAVWFHMDKEADWRVNSSAAALQAYRDALADPMIRTAYADPPSLMRATQLAAR